MGEGELAAVLKRMYENARRNEAVCQINLFGIMYADEIKNNNYNLKTILEMSGIRKGYLTEISKGIKLSKYVTLK
jgi:hypothetical protein